MFFVRSEFLLFGLIRSRTELGNDHGSDLQRSDVLGFSKDRSCPRGLNAGYREQRNLREQFAQCLQRTLETTSFTPLASFYSGTAEQILKLVPSNSVYSVPRTSLRPVDAARNGGSNKG